MKSSAIYTPNTYEVICRVARMAEYLRLHDNTVTNKDKNNCDIYILFIFTTMAIIVETVNVL